jgi:hypothetical protein
MRETVLPLEVQRRVTKGNLNMFILFNYAATAVEINIRIR